MAVSLCDRLQEAALRCCQSEEDEEQATDAAREFVEVLRAPFDNVELAETREEEDWLASCEEMLQQAMTLLDPSSPSGQVLLDHVGWELPLVVVKYVNLSQPCLNFCYSIIEALAQSCNPRELFAGFMEALNILTSFQTLAFCVPLARGLSLVFPRLKRRQADFFKSGNPGLLAVARLTMREEEDGVENGNGDGSLSDSILTNRILPIEDLRTEIIHELILVANAVRYTCDLVEEEQQRESLQQSLGVFTLQLLAIIGGGLQSSPPGAPDMVMQLVELLPLCGISFFELLTSNQIEKFVDSTTDGMRSPHCSQSKSLIAGARTVYWGMSDSKVDSTARESLHSLKEKFLLSGIKGVIAALSLVTSLLPVPLSRPSWLLPEKGVTLLFSILDISGPYETTTHDNTEDDWPTLTLQIVPILQAVQDVIVYAPDPALRRRAYLALTKVIKDVLPVSTRFHSLQALISSCPYPSLVSLLLTCLKDEVARAWPVFKQGCGAECNVEVTAVGDSFKSYPIVSPFVSSEVLQVIESVLHPLGGNPPDLPSQIDSVQGALNLYRFIIIRETSGKTNLTGVLSKASLMKAQTQWLLPLRELLGGIQSNLVVEGDEYAAGVGLAIDNLQSVLIRCLELTEDALKLH
ncbi:unnamed protein product [Sphagnum troendelagicum]|uniref:Uncharacterized protein n=1 Tax=Sphagnum troendelagicum TaxID=128251 RepID=A0ABP0UZB6_9BRYO